jgi:hypothetical protein
MLRAKAVSRTSHGERLMTTAFIVIAALIVVVLMQAFIILVLYRAAKDMQEIRTALLDISDAIRKRR